MHPEIERERRTLAEKVCHDEQMMVWSGEVVGRLSMGDYLREDLSYDEVLGIHSEIANEIRHIAEGAFDHPELDAALRQPTAEPDTAGREAGAAEMRERVETALKVLEAIEDRADAKGAYDREMNPEMSWEQFDALSAAIRSLPLHPEGSERTMGGDDA